MRTATRLFLLTGLLVAFVALAQSQPPPGGGYNLLDFAKGSPTPTKGGVDVTVMNKPTLGYTCTEITIRVIRKSDAKTLDSCTFNQPGPSVSKSFTNLANNLDVLVAVEATFENNGNFDFKDIEAYVTTK